MSFLAEFEQYDWNKVSAEIYAKSAADVTHALRKPGKRTLDDFQALMSPAAADYLEEMAQLSHALTKKRFGKTIQMYAPMYLSNECQNICTYCGFSFHNKIERLTLNDDQIREEITAIKALGYDHILVVTGESNKRVGIDYLSHALEILRPHFSHISIEVQPLEQSDYEALRRFGLTAVLVYQETYHRENYKLYHPKGRKSNFEFRLETADRLGRAGVHKIGLGALIGLEDWRVESFFVAAHLTYLEREYWRTKYSISFPRLRPAEGIQEPNVVMNDRELVQLICAYRIFNENVELSLSTREREEFRNHVVPLGVTSMSAGSKTDPGGYSGKNHALKQFEISDERSPAEVAAMIASRGYEPVWKDWERTF